MHLRVDSVEAALERSALNIHPAEDAGYSAIAAVAGDNLPLGFDAIADTVNPIEFTRGLWTRTAAAASAHLLNVEIVCSDRDVHRRRVETRARDIEGLAVPDWTAVSRRELERWQVARLVVDTSVDGVEDCAATIVREMGAMRLPTGS